MAGRAGRCTGARVERSLTHLVAVGIHSGVGRRVARWGRRRHRLSLRRWRLARGVWRDWGCRGYSHACRGRHSHARWRRGTCRRIWHARGRRCPIWVRRELEIRQVRRRHVWVLGKGASISCCGPATGSRHCRPWPEATRGVGWRVLLLAVAMAMVVFIVGVVAVICRLIREPC